MLKDDELYTAHIPGETPETFSIPAKPAESVSEMMKTGQIVGRIRRVGKAPELAAPFGRCNNLSGIYGADVYAPTAAQILKAENEKLRRSLKLHMFALSLSAVALIGLLAVEVLK